MNWRPRTGPLEAWTQRSWSEVLDPPDAFTALIWRYVPQRTGGSDDPECAPGHTAWAGCGHHKWGEIHIRDRTIKGIVYPSPRLNGIAMHEAIHLLFRAQHSATGIMCIEPDCYTKSVSHGGYRHRYRTIDDAVYALFGGTSAITSGMSVDQVAALFGSNP